MITHNQTSQFSSPWSFRERLGMLLWSFVWLIFCRFTPKPANRWRLFWLRLFGCRISGVPFVHQSAAIQIPWNLILHDRACLGANSVAYSLGEIEIFENATVAQEVYLCTGTHAFDRESMNLVTGRIVIGANAFIGARVFVLPGVTIGSSAIIGACSVVTKDIPKGGVFVGNPARLVRLRPCSV